MDIQTDYLQEVFNPKQYKSTVDKAAKVLNDFDKENPFDTIVFTGISGAALAFPLALALNKPMLCVRKRGSGSHSVFRLEGNHNAERYVVEAIERLRDAAT